MADVISRWNPSILGLDAGRGAGQAAQAMSTAAQMSSKPFEAFATSAKAIVDDYYKTWHNAETLSTETNLMKLFTERNVEVQSTRKMGDTRGLIDDESIWVDKMREEAKKASGLNEYDFNKLYAAQAQAYLTKIGTYQLAEGKKYEEASRAQWSETSINNLATSGLGDLDSLNTFIMNSRQIYANDPEEGMKQRTAAVKAQISFWSMQDPVGTQRWIEQNEGALIQMYGQDVLEIDKVYKAAKKENRADITFWQNQIKFQQSQEDRRLDQYNDQKANEAYMAVVSGEMTLEQRQAFMMDPNITPENKKAVQAAIDKRNNTPYNERQSQLIASRALEAIYSRDINLEGIMALSGSIPHNTLQSLVNTYNSQQDLSKSDPLFYKALQDSIPAFKAFMKQSTVLSTMPASEEAINASVLALQLRAMALPKEDRWKALDPSNTDPRTGIWYALTQKPVTTINQLGLFSEEERAETFSSRERPDVLANADLQVWLAGRNRPTAAQLPADIAAMVKVPSDVYGLSTENIPWSDGLAWNVKWKNETIAQYKNRGQYTEAQWRKATDKQRSDIYKGLLVNIDE